ncbi:MAG: APC family permease [Nanoarchaeota archaeon]|nr:APC family permease [Nanoarchaeota archaeon]MBU4124348.1 APC family permease [Nanoarchaeota archaeon]
MPEGKLKRELGLLEITVYGVGIILGAGIYALIGQAAGIAGNSLWLSFLIGAIIASLTGLSYAELGTMFPKAAAEYVYTKKAFNRPLISFLVGWLILVTSLVSAATVALGFGGYLNGLTGFNVTMGAILLILGCSFLNFYGMKQSARMNVVFTLIEVAGLIMILFIGLPYWGSVNYFEMPNGLNGVFTAAMLIFFAYLGFEDIVNVAEETKKPKQIIPKAIILSVLISTVLYMAISISAISVVPWEVLGQSVAPLADVASTGLPGSGFLLSIIALFATANTVLIILIVNSRMIWGMANDGALPKLISKIHPIRATPYIAVIITMLVCLAFSLNGNIRVVAEITNMGMFLIFISVNAALIYLRYKMPNVKRPFKVPFNIGKLPVLPVLGLLFCVYMLKYVNVKTLFIGIGVIVLGVIVHVILKKRNLIKV